ncbi:4a-hydroxytetrahydrobiopterin dehydratase [Salinicola halophilus]|uniref:4a-hydroxytetrahydrobiopterin dehydratase n=1 Tax=Salinicola halophilus TaxID=184065 RepID=UPI000DA11259|nr:4a-hydroxytetrahydrobiopterin dehydratase [Salinicola halophilus]
MATLTQRHCTPCRGDSPRLDDVAIAEFAREVPKWRIEERDGIMRLERTFGFSDFAQALAFTITVGELAEYEGHHPQIVTEWGRTTVSWWTHRIRGLHANDFIMAARTDEALPSERDDDSTSLPASQV